jgi:hypothetical protein
MFRAAFTIAFMLFLQLVKVGTAFTVRELSLGKFHKATTIFILLTRGNP